jgi:hypothetical protein
VNKIFSLVDLSVVILPAKDGQHLRQCGGQRAPGQHRLLLPIVISQHVPHTHTWYVILTFFTNDTHTKREGGHCSLHLAIGSDTEYVYNTGGGGVELYYLGFPPT